MELSNIRQQINDVDEHLQELLVLRLGLIKDVANIKLKKNLPVFDPKRESIILKAMKNRVSEQLEPYVERMFKAMFDISKTYQEEIIRSSEKSTKKSTKKLSKKETK